MQRLLSIRNNRLLVSAGPVVFRQETRVRAVSWVLAARFRAWCVRNVGAFSGSAQLSGPAAWCEQAQSAGAGDGLGPAVGAELGVQTTHVGLDGVARDEQLVGDFLCGQVGRQVGSTRSSPALSGSSEGCSPAGGGPG